MAGDGAGADVSDGGDLFLDAAVVDVIARVASEYYGVRLGEGQVGATARNCAALIAWRRGIARETIGMRLGCDPERIKHVIGRAQGALRTSPTFSEDYATVERLVSGAIGNAVPATLIEGLDEQTLSGSARP